MLKQFLNTFKDDASTYFQKLEKISELLWGLPYNPMLKFYPFTPIF